ncbi:MAG: prepilin peptidase [Candidatus Hydrothermarchaeota archaeon]
MIASPEPVLVSLALGGAAIAFVTDLKERRVPNRLTLPLIGLGILGNSLWAIYTGDWSLLLELTKGLTAIFVLGYAFLLAGGWSAGDLKLFMFIAALVPRYPAFLRSSFAPAMAPYPFPLTVLLNTVLAVFIVCFPVLAIYALARGWRRGCLRDLLPRAGDISAGVQSTLLGLGLLALYLLAGPYALVLLVPLSLVKLGEDRRLLLSLLPLAAFLSVRGIEGLASMARYSLFLFLSFLALKTLWRSWKAVQKGLRDEVMVRDLEVGMIPAGDIYVEGGRLIVDDRGLVERVRDAMAKGKNGAPRECIARSTAAGLSTEEIAALRSYARERIEVKIGMPFATAVLPGLLLSLALGDIAALLRG